MHPFLFQIGRFQVPTYGVVTVLALLGCVWVIRRYAVREGLDPNRTMDAVVLSIAAGFVGARLLEILIQWDRMIGSGRIELLAFSTGTYLGGLIGAILFGAFWFHRIKLPYLQGLDIVGMVAAVAIGIGRWGCFASGCCWGTPTDLPWAVTFPELAQRLHAGLPGVPIHPTQIYLSLNSLAIFAILALIYRRKRFHGQILMSYLILYPLTRFALEQLRGDEERGFLFGGLLSTSQFLSLILVAAGGVGYYVLARRHRRSGEPDWQPAEATAAATKKGPSRRRGSKKTRR